MVPNDERCFVCGREATNYPNSVSDTTTNESGETITNKYAGRPLNKYDCKNCGVFFYTDIAEKDKKVFAKYLLENNKRRLSSSLKVDPGFHKVIFIVTEKENFEQLRKELWDTLLSIGWVTDKDTVNFVTIDDVKKMGYT